MKKRCTWEEDDEGNWVTGCGHIFCLEADSPIKNGMNFCCYCGAKLEQEVYIDGR
jgi:hypothetical protein